VDWKRQAKDSPMAEEIAAYAGNPVDSVRNLVSAKDTHAIITWVDKRRLWEYWHREPTTDWKLLKGADNAADAKVAAEHKEEELEAVETVRRMPVGAKVVITSEWKFPYHGSKPITVRCGSSKTAAEITGMLKRLGMVTSSKVDKSVDTVPAPA
jgi:hypothetical protein